MMQRSNWQPLTGNNRPATWTTAELVLGVTRRQTRSCSGKSQPQILTKLQMTWTHMACDYVLLYILLLYHQDNIAFQLLQEQFEFEALSCLNWWSVKGQYAKCLLSKCLTSTPSETIKGELEHQLWVRPRQSTSVLDLFTALLSEREQINAARCQYLVNNHPWKEWRLLEQCNEVFNHS